MRTPDFANLQAVLARQAPSRPTLFEFFLNNRLYTRLGGPLDTTDPFGGARMIMRAFLAAGYDYVTMSGCDISFPHKEVARGASRGMSELAIIEDRASFEAYPWPDPDAFDYSRLDVLGAELPPNVKFIVNGPGGVLENVMQLLGYEPLCLLLMDDPALVADVFDAVGSRLLRYYELSVTHSSVGAIISNDDWGFNTQTMLAPELMRQFVFPWHQRIVAAAHAAGVPAILHSCGNLADVMDDIIDVMKFDGKHSYEDKIIPVEEAYELWGHRIAIMGGIDLDFLIRRPLAEVTARSAAMLQRSATRGSFALGTGNSVPEYVPDENYFAMTEAAVGKIG